VIQFSVFRKFLKFTLKDLEIINFMDIIEDLANLT